MNKIKLGKRNDYQDVLDFLKIAFKRKKHIYTSDIMEALAIPYDKVKKITDRLQREGILAYDDGAKRK
jgi:predicted transcriptional regulator